jgi:hypothetical protein
LVVALIAHFAAFAFALAFVAFVLRVAVFLRFEPVVVVVVRTGGRLWVRTIPILHL